QVVHQAGQLPDLPVDHVADPEQLGIDGPFRLQNLDRVAQWAKRIAEFVGENRQKFILATVRFLEDFGRLPAFREEPGVDFRRFRYSSAKTSALLLSASASIGFCRKSTAPVS